MNGLENKLFHKRENFSREEFENRMKIHGFKNIARLELFLWDLELFLQIQDILGERIVLKGGAAVQFYLPIKAQRTSVDIDMLFLGTKDEIDDVLDLITQKLKLDDNTFTFTLHQPKMPKTELPLYTYYVNVPSVLTEAELWTKYARDAKQELKIEFIIAQEDIEISRVSGEDIFAVSSPFAYNVLSINHLFADKLTTLGPNTIGIQDDRIDEQVKQIYDIWMLLNHRLNELNLDIVREKYSARAKLECDSRNIPFDMDIIKCDVFEQMGRISAVDSGNDKLLMQQINNFKGLYLNATIDFKGVDVACAASIIRLLYEIILSNEYDISIIYKAFELETLLDLKLSGLEKGRKVKELRDILISSFSSYSVLDAKILKGKNLKRVFWAVVNIENIRVIEEIITSSISTSMHQTSNISLDSVEI
ncbi:MAG: nucleotidyl transferase AbiEii/AbiGii toxin family protein [Hyphomonadaceae bacterium]|nr:nucleotidyl transferase AbiEii/AbiGii toxin family protein [Clostridia bacterium]